MNNYCAPHAGSCWLPAIRSIMAPMSRAIEIKPVVSPKEILTAREIVNEIYVDEKLTNIELPPNVVLTVSSTVPGVKGDSVSNMVKPICQSYEA